MKTKQELYEEARNLINSVAGSPAPCQGDTDNFHFRANEIKDAFFALESKLLWPCKFAELAVHTRCEAFLNDNGTYPYELLIGAVDAPTGSVLKGTYHYVNDSIGDLKLVCDDFKNRGFEYFVFAEMREGYVVYVPKLSLEELN